MSLCSQIFASHQQLVSQKTILSEKMQQFIAGKTIKKVIVVPKKLVNIVAG
jgi:leucyl-tRNA synthetase